MPPVVGGPRTRFTRDSWTPKEAGGLPNPEVLTSPEGGGVAWVEAPATSHVHSFRYIDATAAENRLLRKFGSTTNPRGLSELHVNFKDKAGGIDSCYAYYFESSEAGWTIFRKMQESGHPYMEVVKPLLRDAGVAYKRIADG
jgi:hypothetical protein